MTDGPETPREKNRRERRGVALTALDHLLTVAVRSYADDRHSQQDLVDAFKTVSQCIGELENEANDAERIGRLETPWLRAPRANRFDCPACGQSIAVDEDGCCRTCRHDATVVRAGAKEPADAK